MDTNQQIEALEFELVAPETRRDRSRMETLLADEFIEVGSSGIKYDKSEVIATLEADGSTEYKLSRFQFTALAADSVLVIYQAVANGKSSHRCSVWVERDNDWQILYHQSTPVQN